MCDYSICMVMNITFQSGLDIVTFPSEWKY